MNLRRMTVLAALAAAVASVGVGEGQAGGGMAISSCGQTVTQSVFLTADLYCAGSTGIVVGADRITIDLKGHTLRGDRTSGHYGVDNSGYDRVTVKNGAVRSFIDGVHAAGDLVGVSGLFTSRNARAGIYVVGNSARIQSVTATGNGQGIDLVGDSGSVKSVTAFGNNAVGIHVGGTSATIQSSTASGNSIGIDVFGASAQVRSSAVTGNSSDGIHVSGASAMIQSSTAAGNYYGIVISGSAAKVQASTAFGNANYGVLVHGDSAAVQGSAASGNGSGGIGVSGDGALIAGNRAEGNGFTAGGGDDGLGILVEGYTTAPVGKNVARGNDDPDECDPVSLC